jgi:hypothetical protein
LRVVIVSGLGQACVSMTRTSTTLRFALLLAFAHVWPVLAFMAGALLPVPLVFFVVDERRGIEP